MEPDRITVVLVTIAGLALLWLGWQFYKAKTLNSIQATDNSPGKPNLLYFTGQYCAACKFQQTPIIEALIRKLGDSIAVKKYDVSDHPDLAGHYKILTLPTTIVINRRGEVVHINRGVAAREQLEAQLEL